MKSDPQDTPKTVEEMKSLLDPNRLPVHIAIVMDGNGRWAVKRHLPRTDGHRAGIQSVRDIVEICAELGIKVLTLYSFSTENWRRPKTEINILMRILKEQLRRETDELDRNNIQIRSIGACEALPDDVNQELRRSIERTKSNTGMKLVLALNYGGREDIVQAAARLARDAVDGKIRPEEINEDIFSSYLRTSGLPDPDLLIRTGGNMRVSNFLLWQISYSEIYVTDVMWPDFRRTHLLEALLDYQSRERRFGGV